MLQTMNRLVVGTRIQTLSNGPNTHPTAKSSAGQLEFFSREFEASKDYKDDRNFTLFGL
jgi:hypothetical protein